ncbi:MAG: hypothetical protein HY700_05785 [Gemmatimonadetes bacterium]|nr:hypothetical protein [Gemmatimonadota bacterium]
MRLRTEAALGLGFLVLLAVLVAAGSWLRDRHILEKLFGEWSAEEVSKLSGGVYRLTFSQPQFSWGRRQVRVDSIAVTTDSARLIGHSDSRPRLALVFRKCELSGVAVVPLALGRGLDAHRFGCDVAEVRLEFPASRASRSAGTGPRDSPFLVLTRTIELPKAVPSIRIRGVMFPRTRLALGQRRLSGARVDLSLLLDWRVRHLDLDPTDPEAMRRPLFSEDVMLQADSVHFRPAADAETSIGHMAIGITDSTLALRNFTFRPTPAEPGARNLRFRSWRLQASAARVAYAGLDLRQLAEGNGLSMRRLEVDSARLDVLSDRRMPGTRTETRKQTPQQWIAELDRGVQVDSVIIRRGSVIYRELRSGHQAPGVLEFEALNAIATNVRHDPAKPGFTDPMRLAVTTRFMDEAKLHAVFSVPLDAPNFALNVRGRVGPMEVTQINRFLQRVAPFQIKSGRVDSIGFRMDVRNGVARGVVLPLYDDLSLDVTGRGMSGVLGGSGVISGMARGLFEAAVNRFGVRRANPEPGKPVREGRVNHTFSPDETLPAFLWNGIRDGLVDVVKVSREKKDEVVSKDR